MLTPPPEFLNQIFTRVSYPREKVFRYKFKQSPPLQFNKVFASWKW
jgi:hypothetical protein